MKLKLKVQRHLVVAHDAEDTGEWVFTLCRIGFSKLIGQTLRPGEEWLVEVTGKPLQLLSNKEPLDAKTR